MVSKDSDRRRFIRRLATVGAAGGVAALMAGGVPQRPLIPLAQAASGGALIIDAVNDGEAGTTELDSTVATGPVLTAYATATSAEPNSAGPTCLYARTDIMGGPLGTGPYPNAIEGYASAASGITTGVYGHVESPDGCGVAGVARATAGRTGVAGWLPTGVYGQSDSISGYGMYGLASNASGTTHGVYGQSDSIQGIGVYGVTSGGYAGVYGESDSPSGIGVQGCAFAGSGTTYGVQGSSTSPDGTGVYGYAGASSGTTIGVWGQSTSPDGTGVLGYAPASSGPNYGVRGTSDSPSGTGVYGYAFAGSGTSYGVYGQSNSPDGDGVHGIATANGGSWDIGPWPRGVEGHASGTSGAGSGVYGHTDSPNADGVTGIAPNSGVYGEATLPTGKGVGGITNAAGGSDWAVGPVPHGVWGYASADSGTTIGVGGMSNSPDGIGVSGYATASTSGATGVFGRSDSPSGYGLAGWSKGICVEGYAMTPGATAFRAVGASGQTASLQEWRRADLGTLAVVDKDGNFGIGTASPVRQLHIVGSNAVARLDRNVDSASFIFVRTNTDYSQVLKTFTFGVKATGVNNGSFFIGDMHTNVSGSSDNRLLIDTNGNVGIGTTTPSSKLHVAGRVKALGYDTGDITFANGVRATEEGEGLAFMNRQGTKMAVLDSQGNLYVKGRVVEGLPS